MSRFFPGSVARAALAFLTLSALAAPGARAEPGASDWSKGQTSAARLVSSGGPVNGVYNAGVEIRLDPGSLTYWRNPGDAGVPPVFSFAGSRNLSSVKVIYPAPRRFEEGGAVVFGYREDIVFPLVVAPLDATKPVELALDLQYAACDRICIPAQARANLRLSPGEPASPLASRVAAFAARAPKPAEGAGAPEFRIAPETAAKPSWSVRVSPRGNGQGELFASFPDGWYFETKATADGHSLTLDQRPPDAASEVEVTLTWVTGGEAWEKSLRLAWR